VRFRTVAALPVALPAFLSVAGHGGEDAEGRATVRERLVQKGKCACDNRSCDGKSNPVCNGPRINCSCGTTACGGSGPERGDEISCCCGPAADPQK
jgi:hypothetical protein